MRKFRIALILLLTSAQIIASPRCPDGVEQTEEPTVQGHITTIYCKLDGVITNLIFENNQLIKTLDGNTVTYFSYNSKQEISQISKFNTQNNQLKGHCFFQGNDLEKNRIISKDDCKNLKNKTIFVMEESNSGDSSTVECALSEDRSYIVSNSIIYEKTNRVFDSSRAQPTENNQINNNGSGNSQQQ